MDIPWPSPPDLRHLRPAQTLGIGSAGHFWDFMDINDPGGRSLNIELEHMVLTDLGQSLAADSWGHGPWTPICLPSPCRQGPFQKVVDSLPGAGSAA